MSPCAGASQGWAEPTARSAAAPLSGTRPQATILYRLEGVTMRIVFEPAKAGQNHRWFCVPADALPIPFSVTDVGRQYLAQLSATESPSEQENAARQHEQLLRKQQGFGRRRWSQKRLQRLTRGVPPGALLVFAARNLWVQDPLPGAVSTPAAR